MRQDEMPHETSRPDTPRPRTTHPSGAARALRAVATTAAAAALAAGSTTARPGAAAEHPGPVAGPAAGAPRQFELYALVDTWENLGEVARVVAAPDGAIYTLGPSEIRKLSVDGVTQRQTPVSGARELAVDGSGRLYVTTEREVRNVGDRGQGLWSDWISGHPHPLVPGGERLPYLQGLAWNPNAGRLTVLFDRDTTLLKDYTPAGGEDFGFDLGWPTHSYWDLVYFGGEAYALNRVGPRIEAYGGADMFFRRQMPLVAPGERFDVGPDGSIYWTSNRTHVYRMGGDGGLMDVWEAADAEPGTPSQITDVAVDGAGRVYVADPYMGQVRVYGLQPSEEGPQIGIDPVPPDYCIPVPSKWADPSVPTPMLLGDRTKVTLRLDGACPWRAEQVDIMLVVDRSNSMSGDKIVAARESVQAFVDLVDLTRDQVGIVSFSSDVTLDAPLTQSRSALQGAAGRLEAGMGTDIAGGVHRALAELRGPNHRRDGNTRRIMVLMTDGKPFDTSRLRAVAAGDAVRYADGEPIDLYTIGLGDDVDPELLRVMARDPVLYRFAPTAGDLRKVYEELATRISASVLFKTVTVTDYVPGNMRYVEGSADRGGKWDPSARTLTWVLRDVPFRGIEMTYWLEPLQVGTWPTNISADFDGMDGLDQPQQGIFPIPEVLVVAPVTPSATPTHTPVPPRASSTPTRTPRPTDTPPTPPTATPTVPTPTPSPTVPPPTPTATAPPTTPPEDPTASPTPDRHTIYVVIVFNDQCFKRYTDVALVIDASTTMLETGEDGRLKLEAAKDAAGAFLDQLSFEPDPLGLHDQAAIVWYNETAKVEQTLTNDRAALDAAIGRVRPAEFTRIDLGLQFGHRELWLDAPKRRLANTPVMVLLSDGLPNRTSLQAVYDAADAAKLDGITLWTVGFGRDVRPAHLQRIASQPTNYEYAPTGAELRRIYAQIAGDVVCR